jgi:phosphomannomutase
MPVHKLHPSILREYDIRGIVGVTFAAADARAIGHAFGSIVQRAGGRTLALGRDGRLSSPELSRAMAQGLAAAGIHVLDIGLGPTPMLYFAVHHLQTDGGAMLTGSHNPPDQNGCKLVIGTKAFFGQQIQELGRLAASGDLLSGEGKIDIAPIAEAYLERLLKDYRPGRQLSIAWDPGNGATGEIIARLVARLPGRHILFNERIDGTFPAHHPDPTIPDNLRQLQQAVRENGCDLGFAFDGDGDRLGVVDERGRILWGDQVLALLAREVLADMPGATVIADVKASQVLFDEIARLGGKPLMWKTGHSLIKSKMAEIKSPLAGEMSGHIFMADRYYGFDDALYVAVRFASFLARGPASAAALLDSLPKAVNTPELRFACEEADKFAAVERIKAYVRQSGGRLDTTDGARVSIEGGWWLVRASNTQAVLVARAEAKDAATLERIKAHLKTALKACGIATPAF